MGVQYPQKPENFYPIDMKLSNKKTLFLILLILTVIILFFNSVFIIPAFYANISSAGTLVSLLFLMSLFSATVILIFFIYILPNLNEDIALARRFTRLESLNHPLLLKLSTEAPGSYHHSINVANLSHQAAKSVGANASMVRVAGYYHDVGKIVHPETYIENQSNRNNKVKNFRQILKMAKVITDHPTVGKKIAEEYNLPNEIVQIIFQHHGTTLAKFLYDQSKDFGKPQIADFRYPGPKPQTIESVIVMLADCVEAATKGASDLDKPKITRIVDLIIEEKITEKQFQNIIIKSTDFQKIRNSLINTLFSMYHQRIFVKEDD